MLKTKGFFYSQNTQNHETFRGDEVGNLWDGALTGVREWGVKEKLREGEYEGEKECAQIQTGEIKVRVTLISG